MARRLVTHPLKNSKRYAYAVNRGSLSEILPQLPSDYSLQLPLVTLGEANYHLLKVLRQTQHLRYRAFVNSRSSWENLPDILPHRFLLHQAYPNKIGIKYYSSDSLKELEQVASPLLNNPQLAQAGLMLLALDMQTGYVYQLKQDEASVVKHSLLYQVAR